jgi:hypothetical protein
MNTKRMIQIFYSLFLWDLRMNIKTSIELRTDGDLPYEHFEHELFGKLNGKFIESMHGS